ncbi:MAG: ribokinase [Clostridia bacterium]|nr:ribokinase [Clostridia bacterium]
MKIYVIGSINMDLVIGTDVMPERGQTLSGHGFMTNPGGKGANQAVAVAKLGGSVEMVGCVGNAFGDELVSTLRNYGVGVKYVKKLDDVSSGIAVIVVSEGDNRIILDAGANGRLDKDAVLSALSDAEAGDWLICQLEVPLDTVTYALKLAKEKKMTTVLNPAPAAKIPSAAFADVDYFVPNQTETEFYTGVFPSDVALARHAADILKAQGIKNVIITMGSEGAAIFADKELFAPSFKVEAIDTTAAGDTFVGALVTRLSSGDDIAAAATYANKASSITVTRKGAQQSIPTKEEL